MLHPTITHAFTEPLLLARLALARARVRLRPAPDTARATRFARSLRLAMPDLSSRDLQQLWCRHRLSMQRAAGTLRHVQTLPPAALERFLDRHVRIEGAEWLEQVRSDPRPVVFVTPHYGDYAVACLKLIQVVGRHKVVNAFYNPPQERRSDEPFETLFKRLGFGFNALFKDGTAVLRALRVLRRGEALTMMPDNFDTAGQPIYVPFFGRLMPAMGGTALFALKSRARLVTGFHCPGRGLGGTLKICEPIDWVPGDRLDEDIAGLTGLVFEQIERQIRSEPEHWEYLGSFDDFIGAGMKLGDARRADDWRAALDQARSQIAALWPELADILHEAGRCTDAVPPQASSLRR